MTLNHGEMPQLAPSLALAAFAFATAAHAEISIIPAPREIRQCDGCFESAKGFDAVPASLARDTSLPKEGYALSVTPEGISIRSADAAGEFYARQTLLQLAQKTEGGWRYPCVEIVDSPAYGWRGVLLDEGRHFFGKETVRNLLDLMAMYKMNVFHWHLTEDQGWRIDVPKYPKLAKMASMRLRSSR